MSRLVLLPHIPAVFMTSLIQTAGHKMAAFSHVFMTFKHQFLTNRTRNIVKESDVPFLA